MPQEFRVPFWAVASLGHSSTYLARFMYVYGHAKAKIDPVLQSIFAPFLETLVLPAVRLAAAAQACLS
jgi:hypothetical protein